MAKLGEVCIQITDGSHNPPSGVEQSEYLMLSSKNIDDDFITLDSPRFLSHSDYIAENKRTTVSEGDLLMTIVGTIGRVAIVPEELKGICLQRSVAVIKPEREVVNNRYLMYQLQNMRPFLEKEARGVAQKGIYLKQVSQLDIKLPELEHQMQIVKVLDKASKLIFLRRQQLAKLDELVKARFVEMFGDPVVNSKRWPVETIENHIDLLTGFPFDSSGYVSKGVNICGGLIIMPQKIDWSACKHWPQITGYEDYILRPNDIVIALDRPWISNGFKIAMVDREHLPALLIQRTARIRAVDINQHYLMQSLLLGRFDKHCNITGSLVPHISPKDIKSYSVMIPPIELQNQFASFVERVDQQKQTVQQSLEKLELMKKALMQEYFG